MPGLTHAAPDWTATGGDAWARRWRDTDRGLEGLDPHLLDAIKARAPARSFKALDVGCGPGSTALAVARERADAEIIACDISPPLVQLARARAADIGQIKVVLGDAEAVAPGEGPFDLIFSRHGVMFFPDPVRAFRSLRGAANAGAWLLFSCFQDWASNPWASELASAAAGRLLPPPGREPGGFAFSDPAYVPEILGASGWTAIEPQSVEFNYVAAEGSDSIEHALDYLAEIGPAARVLQSLADGERADALERMRDVIQRHFNGEAVIFPASAWIWQATAD